MSVSFFCSMDFEQGVVLGVVKIAATTRTNTTITGTHAVADFLLDLRST